MRKSFTIQSTKELNKVAEALIELMKRVNIFAFKGSMGAGKTTFIKAICAALGVENAVNSPTFAIVNEYENPLGEPIFHFDFYRLNKVQEAVDIGFQEYIESGYLCLIEWPEKIDNLLPENCVYVNIHSEDNTSVRTIYWDV